MQTIEIDVFICVINAEKRIQLHISDTNINNQSAYFFML